MELRQLEYFLAVAREGSVTRAARQLYVAQPSLSRQIQKLEEELGAPLFDRSRRGMRLTPVGEIFLEYVQRGFDQFEAGHQAIRDMLGPDRGLIRLAFLPTLGSELLPEVLASFRRRYPKVRFNLRQHTTQPILQWLAAGEIDLGIVTALPIGVWERMHFESRTLLVEELFAALALDHPLSKRSTLNLAELANEPFVMVRPGSGLRTVIETACRAAGFEPQVAVEGEDMATVHGLVAAGLGVSLLPDLAVPERRGPMPGRRLQVAAISLTPPLHWQIDVVWHRDRYLPAAVRTFRDMLLDYIARRPPS